MNRPQVKAINSGKSGTEYQAGRFVPWYRETSRATLGATLAERLAFRAGQK